MLCASCIKPFRLKVWAGDMRPAGGPAEALTPGRSTGEGKVTAAAHSCWQALPSRCQRLAFEIQRGCWGLPLRRGANGGPRGSGGRGQASRGSRLLSPRCVRSKGDMAGAPPGRTPRPRGWAEPRQEYSRRGKGLLARKAGWGLETCLSGGSPPLPDEDLPSSGNPVHAEHLLPSGVWHLGTHLRESPLCSPDRAVSHVSSQRAAGVCSPPRVRPLGGALEPAWCFLQIRPTSPSAGCLRPWPFTGINRGHEEECVLSPGGPPRESLKLGVVFPCLQQHH